jgi:anthranilate phosphoribosyltransferase
VSGSSNVMEFLGYTFTNDAGILEKQIEQSGICFLHAPLFHPAMKAVAPARKELGMRTFFNMLGPLVNPSFPKYQLTGVYNLELARLYHYLLQQTDRRFQLVHSLDGYDELSLTSDFKLISNTREQLFSPRDIGLPTYSPAELAGGTDMKESAELFMLILKGGGTSAQNDVVCANAALAIQCVRPQLSLSDAMAEARESLQSKKAFTIFNKLISHAHA